MSKISQREILSEGFWDKFKTVGGRFGRATKDIIKNVGSVVAPEIADPLKKGSDWLKNTKKSAKRAAMTVKELVKEELIANGYYPYEDKNKNFNIIWAKDKKTGRLKKNTDDSHTGSVKVGQLDYREDGEPEMGAEYSNELKRNVTFTLNFDTREFKIIQHPYRNLSVERPDDNTVTPVTQSSPQNTSTNP